MAEAGNVLAPVLARLGRYDEAVRAYRNRSLIMATVPSAGPISAKPLPAPQGGVITAEAKAEFERAVALNAEDVKASYFLGLAAEQDGRASEGRVDLACDARKSTDGRAVASAGPGRPGAGRRFP